MRTRTLASGVAIGMACLLVAACADSVKSAPTTPPSTTVYRAPVAVAAAAAEPAAVKACRRPHKAGQVAQSFTFQGKRRTYQLYVPAAYKGTKRVPLLFNFHGFGSNAVQQMLYGDFKPIANNANFLIVAPDGQDAPVGRHFSFGNEPGLQSDIAMVKALLGRLQATLCVDAARVYSTGMSDGGAMTSVLACTSPDKFAAFAAVAVVVYCANPKWRAVPIAAFSGTADPIVPFKGGAVHCCGGTVLEAPSKSMAKWAAHSKCKPKATDTRLGSEVRRRTWKGCKPGTGPVFYIIDGGGHTWPGGIPIARFGLTTNQIKASNVIWKFLSAHKLPGA